jgi:hypothetical protein
VQSAEYLFAEEADLRRTPQRPQSGIYNICRSARRGGRLPGSLGRTEQTFCLTLSRNITLRKQIPIVRLVFDHLTGRRSRYKGLDLGMPERDEWVTDLLSFQARCICDEKQKGPRNEHAALNRTNKFIFSLTLGVKTAQELPSVLQ